jgi:hypothetical protein
MCVERLRKVLYGLTKSDSREVVEDELMSDVTRCCFTRSSYD